jgi:hypothetical protein
MSAVCNKAKTSAFSLLQHFGVAASFAICNINGMADTPTPTALAKALGISVPYASQLISTARPWPVSLAIKAFRETGTRFGPITAASDDEIDVLERFTPDTRAAA